VLHHQMQHHGSKGALEGEEVTAGVRVGGKVGGHVLGASPVQQAALQVAECS
jgi:hypothetical protein